MISKLGKFTLMKGPEYRQNQLDRNVMDKAQKENKCGGDAYDQEMKCSYCTMNVSIILNSLILLLLP